MAVASGLTEMAGGNALDFGGLTGKLLNSSREKPAHKQACQHKFQRSPSGNRKQSEFNMKSK